LKKCGDLPETSLESSSRKKDKLKAPDHKSMNADSSRHHLSTVENSDTRSRFAYIGPTSSFSLDWKVLESPAVIATLDESTINYLKGQLQAFPATYSRTGGTLFIHPSLYRDGQPLSLQFASALCKIQTHIPSTKHEAIEQAITDMSYGLLQSSTESSGTFLSKLAFLQSLTLLQIITLFNPKLSQPLKQQAENRIHLLRKWVQELWRSIPAYLPASMSPYEAWVLAESCRRTLLIAYKVVCVHSVLTQGSFTLTMFVEALPVDRNQHFWENEKVSPGTQGSATGESPVPKSNLVSYRELTDMWDKGVEPQNLYEEMLVAACKGVDAVKGRLLQSGEVSKALD
jgi:hypothetical protein